MNKIVYSIWTFEGDDIKSGNIYLATALMSDSLEANTFTATVECPDKEIVDFERNTPLTYYYNNKQRGIFYVQNISRVGPKEYTISATSAIGLLIEGLHYGGIYTGQTVAEVLPSICGTVPYVIKTNLRDIALYGWLPVATPRDNLAQVLFAIGASIRTDLDGVLHIENLWNGVINSLGKDRMYQGATVNYAAKVTQVVVTEHQYVQGPESEQLFEGASAQGDIITFDEPMYDLVASGFSILESGANYAMVSAGSGTLTGKKYIHNTREVTKDVSTAVEPNIKTVKDATLVSLVNSVGVAERLVNYYRWTETIESGVVYQGELPGNRANTWDPYDEEDVTACLESADISLSNTLKSDEVMLVGFIPPAVEDYVTFSEREVLTGSGTWTVPDGVTSIRVALIGAGGPGASGESGGRAFPSWSRVSNVSEIRVTTSNNVGDTLSGSSNASGNYQGAQAGKGGAGGAGGSAGRVYEISLDVSAGDQFSYTCGEAGTTVGEPGGDTTFGDASTASGSIPPAGYADTITGEIFALNGEDGEDGADGGSAGADGNDTELSKGGHGVTGYNYTNSPTYNAPGTYWYGYVTGSVSATVSNTGGGGPGGRSGSVRGEDGGDGVRGSATRTVGTWSVGSEVTVSVNGEGGAGANGAEGKKYGSGGDGGGGGGGAGALGPSPSSASVNVEFDITSKPSRNVTVDVVASCSYKSNGGRFGARGGSGGSGGAGAPGCVIIYYSAEQKVNSGPFQDKNGKFIIDKFGRLIVV